MFSTTPRLQAKGCALKTALKHFFNAVLQRRPELNNLLFDHSIDLTKESDRTSALL